MNTIFWRNRILSVAFNPGTTDVFVGLSSTAPSEDGSGVTEPTGAGYSRADFGAFSSPANAEIHNADPIIFSSTVSVWFTEDTPATHWCLFNGRGPSAQLLASGELSAPLQVRDQVTLRIPAGEISITLTSD